MPTALIFRTPLSIHHCFKSNTVKSIWTVTSSSQEQIPVGKKEIFQYGESEIKLFLKQIPIHYKIIFAYCGFQMWNKVKAQSSLLNKWKKKNCAKGINLNFSGTACKQNNYCLKSMFTKSVNENCTYFR